MVDDENDQEQLYRIQILQAFNLNYWDDTIINKIIAEVYHIISVSDEFKQIFIKARQNKSINDLLTMLDDINSDKDDELIFKILFKFEYFDLHHRCIVDYLINNTLDPIYMNKLLTIL
jgi:hypothetical protein